MPNAVPAHGATFSSEVHSRRYSARLRWALRNFRPPDSTFGSRRTFGWISLSHSSKSRSDTSTLHSSVIASPIAAADRFSATLSWDRANDTGGSARVWRSFIAVKYAFSAMSTVLSQTVPFAPVMKLVCRDWSALVTPSRYGQYG